MKTLLSVSIRSIVWLPSYRASDRYNLHCGRYALHRGPFGDVA